MKKWQDYYKILQIDHSAEPEVIEGAFKKLAKKYHPDVNKSLNAEAMMKQINEAYNILKEADSRENYHREWLKNQHMNSSSFFTSSEEPPIAQKLIDTAKSVLDNYFKSIVDSNYESAYEQIASYDKENISKNDFIKWQSAVSKIFELKEFSCKFSKVYKNQAINSITYQQILEFHVYVKELNRVMDRTENDNLIKKVVFENERWSIFIGYEEIQPLINRFEGLTNLVAAKSVMSELSSAYNKTDFLTGLLNRKGFFEAAEKEIYRTSRYSTPSTLIMCRLTLNGQNNVELRDHLMEWSSELIQKTFRKADVPARWDSNTFVILLPITELPNGISAAIKMRKVFDYRKTNIKYNSDAFFISIGVSEITSSGLNQSIESVENYVKISAEQKKNMIISEIGTF